MKAFIISALVLTGIAQAAPKTFGSSYEASSGTKTYLGFASDSTITGNALPAASLMLGLSDTLNVQTYFQIPTIDPFLFTLGGNAKITMFGNQAAGFHVGGGLAFSLISAVAASATDTRDFVLRFNGIAGAHFYLVNRVMVIVDGGLSVSMNTDNSDADMSVGGNSALLGLSVLYEI